MSQHEVVLLLGSNLGDKKKNIEEAMFRLRQRVGDIQKATEIMETEPVEFESENVFCNLALRINTSLSPTKTLQTLKKIENEMGRLRDTKMEGKFVDRIIDIDIVHFNKLNFQSAHLQLPHIKHLYERNFSTILLNLLKEKQ